MKRTVLKCDGCDTTVVDQSSFEHGAELWYRPQTKGGGYNWKKSRVWHFCQPCQTKAIKRLVKKYGEGASDDEDD